MSPKSVEKRTLIIPGAQKSGTSSLFLALARHEKIGAATVNEPQFFALDRGTISSNFSWYMGCFPGDKPVLLDKSTFYLHSGRAPKNVADFCSDPYVVVLVRDPARRAYSGYMHMYKKVPQRERREFEDILHEVGRHAEERDLKAAERTVLASAVSEGDIDPDYIHGDYLAKRVGAPFASHFEDPLLPYSYFWQSRYIDPISRWKDVLGHDRVLVVFFEEMIMEPGKTVSDVLAFIGLSGEDGDLNLPHGNPTRLPGGPVSRLVVRIAQRLMELETLKSMGRISAVRGLWSIMMDLIYEKPSGPDHDCYRQCRRILESEYAEWADVHPKSRRLWNMSVRD